MLSSRIRFPLAAAQRRLLTTNTSRVRGPQSIASCEVINLELDDKNPEAKKVYTVRPVTFWMDKVLETENKKSLTENVFQDRPQIMKKMSDSYIEELLPFKSSPELLDKYVTAKGTIRIGKILEDLDALAGAISYKHIDTFTPGPPVTIVTASVDRMEILMPSTVEDLKISGHVAYVGSSSMEVFAKVETIPQYDPSEPYFSEFSINKPTPNTVIFARFTMVARNSITGKAVKVNPMVLENAEEKKLFMFAEDCKSRKRLAGAQDLSKIPPTADERLIIHDIYVKNLQNEEAGPNSNAVPMEATCLQSVFLMQPQNRNIHNNVFGGYLMRRAYELAHSTGSMLVKSQVSLLSLDEIVFKKPVSVGSLLNLSSKVIYSQGDPSKSFQISVTASVNNIEAGTSYITNTFHFTFASNDKPVPQVLPKTYAESMLYLEGKRRRVHGLKAKKSLLELMQNSSE
ncbi:HotDog domain-containing protein, partial [Phycomyces nitens]